MQRQTELLTTGSSERGGKLLLGNEMILLPGVGRFGFVAYSNWDRVYFASDPLLYFVNMFHQVISPSLNGLPLLSNDLKIEMLDYST